MLAKGSHNKEVLMNTLNEKALIMNYIDPDVQAGLEKAEKTEIKLPTSVGSSKKREFQKNVYFFIDYAKAFDCVDHNKLWKILKEMGIPTT